MSVFILFLSTTRGSVLSTRCFHLRMRRSSNYANSHLWHFHSAALCLYTWCNSSQKVLLPCVLKCALCAPAAYCSTSFCQQYFSQKVLPPFYFNPFVVNRHSCLDVCVASLQHMCSHLKAHNARTLLLKSSCMLSFPNNAFPSGSVG